MSATHRTKEERLVSSDKYYTKPGLARKCITTLIEDGWVRDPARTRVLEPSVGRGAWLNALILHKFETKNIWVNDIDVAIVRKAVVGFNQYEYEGMTCWQRDALDLKPSLGWDLICGNPPFNDAGSHIEVSLSLLSPMGVLAYLLPIGWFTARGKQHSRISWIKTDGKPRHLYLITPRPSFSDSGTDSATYVLAVWAPGAKGFATTLSIIDWYEERETDHMPL